MDLAGQLGLALAYEQAGQDFALQLLFAELCGSLVSDLAQAYCIYPQQLHNPQQRRTASVLACHTPFSALTKQQLLEDGKVLAKLVDFCHL